MASAYQVWFGSTSWKAVERGSVAGRKGIDFFIFKVADQILQRDYTISEK